MVAKLRVAVVAGEAACLIGHAKTRRACDAAIRVRHKRVRCAVVRTDGLC
jgi:hypothetical protein